MSRRKNQLFNLSFLDLITGALGAVIFLFIITPKGGSSAPDVNQVVMYMDTTEMKIFGNLHDSLRSKQVGDTLFTVLVDYKNWPKPEPQPERVVEKVVERVVKVSQPSPPKPKPTPVPKTKEKPTTKPPVQPEKTPSPPASGPEKTPVFTGDAPTVPCKVSFEINWANAADNIDLYVCKDGDCVYGGRKRDQSIGQWDSGKSRNRIFGNDLRTNQEAVRQFDRIIPGEYMIYARFKESSRNVQKTAIKGLVYTKDRKNQQRGEHFTKFIPNNNSRVLLGKVILKADGSYQFIKK